MTVRKFKHCFVLLFASLIELYYDVSSGDSFESFEKISFFLGYKFSFYKKNSKFFFLLFWNYKCWIISPATRGVCKIIIIIIGYTLTIFHHLDNNIIVDHGNNNNFKLKIYLFLFEKIIICFVNVDTDPRLRHLSTSTKGWVH
jgi:hypothetical protein